jgi:hypothetical protein
MVVGLGLCVLACTDEGERADDARPAQEPTTTPSAGGIAALALDQVVDGWTVREVEPASFRPHPADDCRGAGLAGQDIVEERVVAATRDAGGASLTVELTRYAHQGAVVAAWDELTKLDAVCVLPRLGGLEVSRRAAPDEWLDVGGRSWGWHAEVNRIDPPVGQTNHDAIAFVEGDVLALVWVVTTDGYIPDPVPIAEDVRRQIAI